VLFEKKLEERGILTRTEMDELRAKYTQELLEASKRIREEPQPTGADIWRHVFAERDVLRDSAPGNAKRNGA
jgi:2-oxoisovalerate dehydrogenase E1 component alpha subunit